jgi:high-affinity iron transporter
MVTYMIVWMRKHSRKLKGSIESDVAHALAEGSVKALVVMAFLAVFREGLETAVFLLAVFQNSSDTTASASGALLGLGVAVIVGYALYKGGLRINLARFFKFTGVVLVLVAAGLVASAAHTAHEGAWLNSMQTEVFDLRWLISPGSVQSAIAAGMFGIQPQPVVAEVVAWLLYAIPMMAFVLWPARRPIPTPASGRPDSFSNRTAVGAS